MRLTIQIKKEKKKVIELIWKKKQKRNGLNNIQIFQEKNENNNIKLDMNIDDINMHVKDKEVIDKILIEEFRKKNIKIINIILKKLV